MRIPGFTAEMTLLPTRLPYRAALQEGVRGEVVPQGWGCAICIALCVACLANPELIPVCIEPCVGCVAWLC